MARAGNLSYDHPQDEIPNVAKKEVVAGVDDDFRVRESIASLLESAGYAAITFGSAEELLESGRLCTVRCVVADIRMPGMNGLQMARRIRDERRRMPIIFISAHHDDAARQRALAEGAVNFFYKPFDAGSLLDAVREALARNRDRDSFA